MNFSFEYKLNSLNIINKFKALKNLEIKNLIFIEALNLNIKDLEYLKLIDCENINIYSDNMTSKIKVLKIKGTKLINDKSEIIFSFMNKGIFYFEEVNNIINFNSLINLKKLKAYAGYFIIIKNSPLEKVEIRGSNEFDTYQIISKIIEINSIIEAKIFLNLENKLISDIKGVNNNLKILKLCVTNIINKLTIEQIIKNFPNLEDFNFKYMGYSNNKNELFLENEIYIEENQDCKINKLYLNLNHIKFGQLIFHIHSFSNLKKLSLMNINIDKNLFPLFNDKCNIIFLSLEVLTLIKVNITIKIFENIINNIDKCLKIKEFNILNETLNISKDYYFSIIRKLVSIKTIDSIDLLIFGDKSFWKTYSQDELKEICGELYKENNRISFEEYPTHRQ